MEEQTKDFQDYIAAVKKRKKGITIIVISVFIISALVAFLLPPVYKSTSTILIEQQEIPQELVQSTVTSYAAERIQVIQARVMSRANLMSIIEKFNLYENERKHQTTGEIIKRISEDIALDMVSVNVVDPRSGKPTAATIAFSLSFEHEKPATAQRVANELTSLYLSENLKNRAQKAVETASFFRQESERLQKEIGEYERKLAVFKQDHADALPGLQGLNQQILQRKESERDAIKARLVSLEDKKFYLDGQLAQIEPGNPALMGASSRLKLAEAEYLTLKARYSDEHPDVVNLKKVIKSLREEEAMSDNAKILSGELVSLRAELAVARKKYTKNHPDVRAIEAKIEALNKELGSIEMRSDEKYYQEQPENPAYITLKAQLAGINSEVKAEKENLRTVNRKIDELEAIMQTAPQIEREYVALNRLYNNAIRAFQENEIKQSRADIAQQLETEKKGERFSLIDPPEFPEKPISPNRPAIILIGLFLSVLAGLGYAFISDAISGSVRGAKNIRSILGVAPLAVIPYQMNMSDIKRKKRIQKRAIIVGLLIIVSIILVIHVFISPLDVLWFRMMRKIDIFVA